MGQDASECGVHFGGVWYAYLGIVWEISFHGFRGLS